MNNSGITNFNVLNTNFLYIQGIAVDFGATSAYLQGEIDAIEQQLIGITAITNRIDFNTAPALVGDLVITEDNKNSVLLTAIQNINTQIASLNKLDLTALPSVPAGACVITPTTTNQYLNGLIATNTADIVTINGQITTIQGQISTINGQITAINNKLAHFSTFTYGSDTMSGIADGTGFACAVSGGSASGNGIFVYPNNSSVGTQIQLMTAYDKDLLIRGGDKTAIYAGNNGSMTSRNLIDIGDVTDRISIGRNQGLPNPLPRYSLISIGVDTSIEGSASTTEVEGDIYFSSYAFYPPGITPCLVAETTNPLKLGNTNNYSSDLTLTGLDVTGAGVAPITLTAVSGAIPISAALGLISLTALAGGITLATGAGIMTINCGAGGFFLNSGAGVMNFASGQGNINMTTITGDIVIGAGKALGGNAGDTILNAFDKIVLSPDNATEIFKTAYIEMNTNATAPAITASRVYDINGQLYYNGAALGGGGGSTYVLKAGDTMTGTLNLPEANTSILTLQNLLTPPSPITNRLYLLNNVLTFNGVAVGGGGAFVPLAGNATMTGSLTLNYDAGANSQLNITNTSTTLATGGAINIRNDSVGAGSIGERCGKIDFSGRDGAGAGGRTYAAIAAYINDPTQSAIDGRLSSFVASNNTLTEFQRFISTSTGVRQVNINAQNTTIGTSALGSASTDTLRVQGNAVITTTLDVPLIQNAPAIYPATSTTLVDGAVKQYRPERIFRLADYPSPLSGPSLDGEKVIVLNSGGNPANVVDSILQSSDFPTINGATFVRILQIKYVEGTLLTPPMNVITAIYNELNQRIHVFVQADTSGLLTPTRVASLYFAQGQALVNDFCVTTYQSKTRIYAGGQFSLCDTPAPYAATTAANNFSGQIVVSWSAGTISNIVCNPMNSNATSQDGQGAIWGGVDGVNDNIRCVIDATGYSGIPQPPTTGLAKYDSIVIGGEFFGIGSSGTTDRALRRLAYYDWFLGNGTNISLVNQPPPVTFSQIIGSTDVTAQFTIPSAGIYTITAGQMCYFTSNPTGYSASFGIYLFNQNTSSSSLISDLSSFTLDGDSTPNRGFTSNAIQLTPQTGGNYYYIRCNTGGPDISPLDVYTGLQNNALDLRCCVATAVVQSNNWIGWRPFQDTNWATPEGPDGDVFGGALTSNGTLGFAYGATTITTLSSPVTSNYAFSLQYNNGTASFGAINSDPDAIASGQSWDSNGFQRNCVTGGNPVLAFGAGNAIAYGQLYFNTGQFNAQSTYGVSYRPSAQDPYETTDCLVLTDTFSINADQLKPQFSSQPCYGVYRDDTKYPDVFFLARGNELSTATLPFASGIPNYNSISFNSQPIPCFSFGGYSDEVGYVGALFVTNTNLYLYKLTSSGELVIDLTGCVVRTFNDVTPSIPIVATNKLTFPAFTDGGSVVLCGDISTSPVSWWAISQDGPLYYDNTLIGGSGGGGGGVNSVTGSGAGISITPTTGAVVVSNTGVTELTAGSGIAVSAQTGQVTLSTQTGYATWGTTGSGNSVVVENTATNFWGEGQFIFFTPPAYTTGLGNNFVAGNSNRIRWNGTNPISITGQISLMVTLQHFQNGSWFNVVNISQLPGQLPDHVGFGARFLVTDQNAVPTPNSMGAFDFCINRTNSIDGSTNPGPIGGLVGNMTFTTNMRPGDELYIGFITNSTFNSIGAGQYRVLFDGNQTNSSSGGISFQISEMPFT